MIHIAIVEPGGLSTPPIEIISREFEKASDAQDWCVDNNINTSDGSHMATLDAARGQYVGVEINMTGATEGVVRPSNLILEIEGKEGKDEQYERYKDIRLHRVIVHTDRCGIPLTVEMYGRKVKGIGDGGPIDEHVWVLCHWLPTTSLEVKPDA